MRRAIGRRALFFAFSALICLALVPATPGGYRWVAWATAALGGIWAVLLAIEDLMMPRAESRRRHRQPFESPFSPPPPPKP